MFLSKITNAIRSQKIHCSAVIVAAGNSQRFGHDKLMAPLLGVPVIAYSLSVFQECDYVDEIVLVVSEENLLEMAQVCDANNFYKVSKVLIGGRTRVESALCGASECSPGSNLIAIHDGARPLVTPDVINKCIEGALLHMAAVPAVASRDTIKIGTKHFVKETPDREDAFIVQTPQVFEPTIVKGALTNALSKNLKVFDDASAVEALGVPVYITEGSEENIKITTPLDLKLAEIILMQRRERLLCESEAAQ